MVTDVGDEQSLNWITNESQKQITKNISRKQDVNKNNNHNNESQTTTTETFTRRRHLKDITTVIFKWEGVVNIRLNHHE